VLLRCGISEERARRTVRFSLGRETTIADLDRVVAELKAINVLNKFGSSLLRSLNAGPVAGL
jgi:cysteine sulfinate desulfinase/cysteine desulfurase-like protein